MREIKTLMRQLRHYPDNFFVYPGSQCDLPEGNYSPEYIESHTHPGLWVCDVNGVEKGFIETGGKEGVIVN